MKSNKKVIWFPLVEGTTQLLILIRMNLYYKKVSTLTTTTAKRSTQSLSLIEHKDVPQSNLSKSKANLSH